MFDFVEEALNSIALFVEPRTECRYVDPPWHGANAAPRPFTLEVFAQSVAIVGAVCKQNVSLSNRRKHIVG